MKLESTQFGFKWGSLEVQRYCSDEGKGWVALGLITPRARLQVYVTRTGKVRVYNDTTRKELK